MAKQRLTAFDVIRRYIDENIPEFVGLDAIGINQKGGFGNTLLNIASTRGEIEEVDALLDAGADPNIQGEHGCTPLHDAVGQGHLEIVRRLLERGASVKILNDAGIAPRERAAQKGRKDIIELFDDECK